MIQDGGKWMRVQSSDFGKVKPPSSRVDLGVFRTVGYFSFVQAAPLVTSPALRRTPPKGHRASC